MRHLKFGLLVCHENEATVGYTLFSPLYDSSTYLVDLRGDVVHRWHHALINSTYAYLLENGNLLWVGRLSEGPQGMGGRACPNAFFAALGLPSLVPSKLHNSPNRRIRTRAYGGVGGAAS
jgi:hypothetical protein